MSHYLNIMKINGICDGHRKKEKKTKKKKPNMK